MPDITELADVLKAKILALRSPMDGRGYQTHIAQGYLLLRELEAEGFEVERIGQDVRLSACGVSGRMLAHPFGAMFSWLDAAGELGG